MDAFPNSETALGAGAARTRQELEHALKQSEAELSERDRLLEEMRRLVDALERSLSRREAEMDRQKVALKNASDELESFNYSVSHDLRAPLRHLTGFSSALLEDFGEGLDNTAQSYLDCIVRAGKKMEGLLEALLGLSRIARQEMTVQETDLGQLARHCADFLREGEPGRQVELLIPERLPVHADPQLLRVALEHLLGNAWKFTGKKDGATIEVGVRQEEGRSVYFVRDDGTGFDPRYAGRLFAPFQRMHREEEFTGLGIGLATVQRIVRRHGGRIWAEAEPGRGATFFFTLSG